MNDQNTVYAQRAVVLSTHLRVGQRTPWQWENDALVAPSRKSSETGVQWGPGAGAGGTKRTGLCKLRRFVS